MASAQMLLWIGKCSSGAAWGHSLRSKVRWAFSWLQHEKQKGREAHTMHYYSSYQHG